MLYVPSGRRRRRRRRKRRRRRRRRRRRCNYQSTDVNNCNSKEAGSDS
jgi:hypothetical protein